MTEKEKMINGKWYDANFDTQLLEKRLKAEDLCFSLNTMRPTYKDEREEILKQLIPGLGDNCTVLSPFMTDYGCYIKIGNDCFINHNAYFMDGGGIEIGHNCFIGPDCGIYTAVHPLLPEERNQGIEKAMPVKIGNNCWIGAKVTVLPGVTIGEGTVIGAGSVVTKNIPAGVVATGNPCRVIREITDKDSIYK